MTVTNAARAYIAWPRHQSLRCFVAADYLVRVIYATHARHIMAPGSESPILLRLADRRWRDIAASFIIIKQATSLANALQTDVDFLEVTRQLTNGFIAGEKLRQSAFIDGELAVEVIRLGAR